MLSEIDADAVITVMKMAQHTDEQEVGAEEKLQPKVKLQGIGRCKVSTGALRN